MLLISYYSVVDFFLFQHKLNFFSDDYWYQIDCLSPGSLSFTLARIFLSKYSVNSCKEKNI